MPQLSDNLATDLSANERSLWAELIRRRCGLSFADNRPEVLARAVRQRTQARHLPSGTAYYHLLLAEGEGGEWAELQDLLLNNESAFFRHPPSFDALARAILPAVTQARRARGEDVIRMWSAGCSAGQEAYSLAAAFLLSPGASQWRLRVVGSDLSRKALAQARQGRYRPHEMRGMNATWRGRYFRQGGQAQAAYFEATDELKAVVTFERRNLCGPEPWPEQPQDVVFCQNVLIYFRPADRAPILRRLVERLVPGGYLILSPTEAMGVRPPGTVPSPCDAAVFQRIP